MAILNNNAAHMPALRFGHGIDGQDIGQRRILSTIQRRCWGCSFHASPARTLVGYETSAVGAPWQISSAFGANPSSQMTAVWQQADHVARL